jgi:hypothetical protein
MIHGVVLIELIGEDPGKAGPKEYDIRLAIGLFKSSLIYRIICLKPPSDAAVDLLGG